MHEMTLCEAMLAMIETSAAQEGFQRVHTIWLDVGVLAAVDWEALEFCFSVIRRGTVADQATLKRNLIPARAWCLSCNKFVLVQQRYDPCPECGRFECHLAGEDQLKIKQLEVE